MKDNLMNPTSNVVIKSEPSLSLTDENSLQSSANSCTSSNGTPKRPVTLDLAQITKKPQIIGETPDSQNMKSLGTPDLEKLLHMIPTPQSGPLFPTKSSSVTSEQEAFGKGFEEALHSLRNSKTNQTLTNPAVTAITPGALTGEAFTYTNLDMEKSFPINVKDEQQNQQATAPVNRIDMEAQEKIKLERKRQRNRVAASKCRKRKLERISKLEERVKGLKNENSDLSLMAKNLKEHIAQLKQQVMEHVDSGCNIQALCTTSLM